ncbi:hypothetical protein PanWU01x14_020650 [Parasponia andersonii]|uniref:Uncharacterized protein n=1 Tax=Parasponia andersonii TaxID=3476 RepID=A0A2P5DYS6_PARAD|nr:hypothetical protein PanWU01x14_020650 [Parasponia andersonii]
MAVRSSVGVSISHTLWGLDRLWATDGSNQWSRNLRISRCIEMFRHLVFQVKLPSWLWLLGRETKQTSWSRPLGRNLLVEVSPPSCIRLDCLLGHDLLVLRSNHPLGREPWPQPPSPILQQDDVGALVYLFPLLDYLFVEGKMISCTGNNDIVTIKTDDTSDSITLKAPIKKLDGSEFRNAFSKASGSMIQKGTRLGALVQVMVDLILGVGVTATAIVEAKVTVRAEVGEQLRASRANESSFTLVLVRASLSLLREARTCLNLARTIPSLPRATQDLREKLRACREKLKLGESSSKVAGNSSNLARIAPSSLKVARTWREQL